MSEYKDAVAVVLKTVNITQPTHGALAVKWIGVAGNHDTELDSGDKVPANTELTLSGNYRPVKWFEATLSYSFIHSKFKTYGIALNFSPSWINFFIGSDYMLTKVTPQCLPVSGNAMNLYMGVSVPLKSFAN